ncbi:MAG: hypothetical protein IPK08_10095 [Bacteroidetes bacterium]|nr:hypothetical protein [Bacteroidota bacterium]
MTRTEVDLSIQPRNGYKRGRQLPAMLAAWYFTLILIIRYPSRFTVLIKHAIELIAANSRSSLFGIGVCSSLLWVSLTTVTNRFTAVSITVEQGVYLTGKEAQAKICRESCENPKKFTFVRFNKFYVQISAKKQIRRGAYHKINGRTTNASSVVVHRASMTRTEVDLSIQPRNGYKRGRQLPAMLAAWYFTLILIIRYPSRFTVLIKHAIELIAANSRSSLFGIGVCSSLSLVFVPIGSSRG